jgi:hypothetical protein
MQKINTMSSPALDRVKREWEFAEVWIEPTLAPPYILLLLGDRSGSWSVYDPAEGYRLVWTGTSYEEARDWLCEDEFEPIEGRLAASEG